jgi:dipeptidyl-peptidase-4
MPEDTGMKHIYAIQTNGKSDKICLTCTEQFKGYSYFEADNSENGRFMIIHSLGPQVPKIDLFELKIEETFKLNHVKLWESNNQVHQTVARKKVPGVIYDELKLADGRTTKVMMYFPIDIDESKKYPMLIEVYGAPSFFKVTRKWQADWGTYLTSKFKIIYVKIDGRGSGLSGNKVLYSVYKNLGSAEIEDQIETATKLKEKYSFIDANRTGIWGKSFGGYTAGMALTKDKANVIQCGASISPLTDLSLYDSIYIERYMGDYEENRKGYENSNILNFVENFRNKSYMLIHGSLDDNVHYQQSMVLSRALELKDIQFDQIVR